MPTNRWSIYVEGEKAFVFLCGKRLSRKCKDFGHLKHAETETYKGQPCIKVSLMSLPIQTSSSVLTFRGFRPSTCMRAEEISKKDVGTIKTVTGTEIFDGPNQVGSHDPNLYGFQIFTNFKEDFRLV